MVFGSNMLADIGVPCARVAIRIRDDLNRDVVLLRPPQRIVSLVPSDTYTLFAAGAGDRVVGRTRYCVEPEGRVEDIPVCGGTKDVDVQAVADLQPDLVLCNQEENARPALETLARHGHQVFVSLLRRVADGVAHVARLVRMLGLGGEPAARDLVRRGHALLRRLGDAPGPARSGDGSGPRLRVFMPIWMDPLMTLNADTFGSDMLAVAGADNVFGDRLRLYPLAADLGKRAPRPAAEVGDRDVRYPRVSWDEVVERAPEAVLLPDEPFAFTDADAEVFAGLDIPAARRGAIRRVDGRDLFWYGARSVDAVPRLEAVIAELTGRGG